MPKEALFIDIEATYSGDIREVGVVYKNEELKTNSLKNVKEFIAQTTTDYIVGHNIIEFDKKLLEKTSLASLFHDKIFIDTLSVSMLLFNEKTFHALPKNYKNEDCFLNDPVKDALLSKDLLFKSIEKFKTLPQLQRNILYTLLKDEVAFQGFFDFISDENIYEELSTPILKGTILSVFDTIIINEDLLEEALLSHKIELAFILAIRMPELEVNSQPPKVLYDYENITSLQKKLCFDYDKSIENLSNFAEDTFGFGTFRDFPRQNATLETGSIISQQEIVEAALKDNESFLVILPTGGGKTFTFWLPALVKAKALKTLTVVISPLQALIKDHMDSFHESVANYKAVALSGYLSPIERSAAIEQVINGDADVLYLAPESLRSNSVFNLLKNRVIERFVIDEAHCLSTWGNDFRHDYFYIGEFIKDLLEAKPFQDHIPVSCFTATGKPKVIDDITNYIEESLNVKMNHYIAVPERKNLDYEGRAVDNDKAKYTNLLELINTKKGSTLIYIPSSTKTCDKIAEQLAIDTGKNVQSFHGKLETDIKMEILKDYIDDKIDIVVATTAFGMGVDKPNIKNVIHYEISESLENYAQEAGRGARDQNLRASCPLLFSQADLDKHFTTLSRSKLNADEINAVFRVLKSDSRNPVTFTTREIAAHAGWDTEDSSSDYDMKVKTALLELEREEYLERSRNQIRYYADAVSKDAFARLESVCKEDNYDDESKVRLSRVLHTVVGSGKPDAVQLDELTEVLGYPHEQVSQSVLQLKDMGIITDAQDLSLIISKRGADNYFKYQNIEKLLLAYLLQENTSTVRMSTLNQYILDNMSLVNENLVKTIKVLIKSWKGRTHQFKFNRIDRQKDLWYFEFLDKDKVKSSMTYKHSISSSLVQIFSQDVNTRRPTEKLVVEFSLLEVQQKLNIKNANIIDKALLHLHELKVLELGKGRFIYYSPMKIIKSEKMLSKSKRKYTKQEYQKRLGPYYQYKMESIHIVGEYSSQLVKNTKKAQLFMKDYFTLSYKVFVNKYGELKEKFKRPMTEYRYNKIYNELSPEQKVVIEDKDSQAMMILAGPGSGKTKVLVHKIASLILQEDIKPDQFLMLTYSRTAMLEFKSRLFQLIGQLAYDIDIFTFHGFALQLIGQEVDSDKNHLLKNVISLAAQQINESRVEVPFKTVLVLDEYQDINHEGFELVKALANAHENKKRIIAVGDDDQCILKNVNGADVAYIKKFEEEFALDDEGIKSFSQYELLTNFRSDKSIVEYSNAFVHNLTERYKQHPLVPNASSIGEVTIVQCASQYLEKPAVMSVKENLTEGETVAVLAFSNNEVADIYALLHEEEIKVSYLLSSEGFSLNSLVEISYVNELLNGKNLDEELVWWAFEEVKKRYKDSKNLGVLHSVVKSFIRDHEVYTQSLWQAFLEEISSEQFTNNSNHVLVSTIHKSKGKEFDTVVLVAHKQVINDEFRRLFYVGMTRAKKKLIIVTDHEVFNQDIQAHVRCKFDVTIYPEPNRKTLVMGLTDLWLSFQGGQDIQGVHLIAGTKATIEEIQPSRPYFIMQDGLMIARFSKKMQEQVKELQRQNYKIIDVEIENVIHWLDEDASLYRQEPLCKIVLQR